MTGARQRSGSAAHGAKAIRARARNAQAFARGRAPRASDERRRAGVPEGSVNMEASKMKIVYAISDRNSRKYWNRIGVAFINGDGSINVKLEAVPVSGEMQIRDYVPRDDARSAPRARLGSTESLAPVVRSATEHEAGDADPRCA
jgi:hypothetical protein